MLILIGVFNLREIYFVIVIAFVFWLPRREFVQKVRNMGNMEINLVLCFFFVNIFLDFFGFFDLNFKIEMPFSIFPFKNGYLKAKIAKACVLPKERKSGDVEWNGKIHKIWEM